MKAVIIGGGIAGLGAAISLQKIGWDVTVKEKTARFREVGLGFIIMPNGLSALDKMGCGVYARSHGQMLKGAIMRHPDGVVFKTAPLSDCLAIKRSTCIDALRMLVREPAIHTGFEFSHFEFNKEGKAVAAVSTTGEKETGDLFIAADGANSVIRKKLFPLHEARQSPIQELVGIIDDEALALELDGHMLKTQCHDKPLSMGLVPCNSQQVIWYMQFDSTAYAMQGLSNDIKKDFATQTLAGWPPPVQQVIRQTDFNKVFLWLTRDMDLLNSFHRQNIVLIGDAAHLALPFTSQGTNSALTDAMLLSELLQQIQSPDDFGGVFAQYYQQRKNDLQKYLEFGRKQEDWFLHPELHLHDEAQVPLAK
ncbi:FAD-dependent monooxygenase [Filimonas effusa]|uniref:FAD-binding protein n=1 Tax=Filimonas effusa TaxID=2508721 RepID=A0A4Q1CYX0_9BACT|nr:FAD-dependent monooxygenase [Filimonas effusa]RXK80545.1 FAD-binding protein [Filimonas effusa]